MLRKYAIINNENSKLVGGKFDETSSIIVFTNNGGIRWYFFTNIIIYSNAT